MICSRGGIVTGGCDSGGLCLCKYDVQRNPVDPDPRGPATILEDNRVTELLDRIRQARQ